MEVLVLVAVYEYKLRFQTKRAGGLVVPNDLIDCDSSDETEVAEQQVTR